MGQIESGWGFASGTFGELVQGEIDNTPFLITLPIPWGTRAVFHGTPEGALELYPAHKRKARRAAELVLEEWGYPQSGVLVVQSALPVGKGMASSSADVVAVIRAVAAYWGKSLEPGDAARLAAQIEPSDGIMYPGVVALNPRTGQLLERMGPVPSALVVGVLGHGRINTEDHHRLRERYEARHQDRLKEALKWVRRGVKRRDVAALGQAGRISAEVQLERHPDEALARFLEIADQEGLGVMIGHSGTVKGALLPLPTPSAKIRRVEQRLWALDSGPVYRIQVGPVPTRLSGKGDWRGAAALSRTPDSLVP